MTLSSLYKLYCGLVIWILLPAAYSTIVDELDLIRKETYDVSTLYTSNFGNPIGLYSDALIEHHDSTSTLVVSTGKLNGNVTEVFIALVDRESGTYYHNITIHGDADSYPADLIINDDEILIAGGTKASVFDGISIAAVQSAFVIKFQIESSSSTPSLQKLWTKVFGPAGSTVAAGVAVHESTIITFGSTNGLYLDSVPSGTNQLFLRKTDSQGNWLSTVFVDIGPATPRKIASDSHGNIFAVGISLFEACQGGYSSSVDVLLMKLNFNGTLMWCQQIGSAEDDDVADLQLQEDIGSVVLIGYADFANIKDSSGTVLENGFGLNDAMVLKYSMDLGIFQNGTYLGTAGIDYGLSLTLNSGNNLLSMIVTMDASTLTIYKFGPESLEEAIFNYTMGTFQLRAGGLVAESSRKGYFYTVGLSTGSIQPSTMIATALLDSYPDAGLPSASDKKSKDVGLIVGCTIAGAVVLLGGILGFVQVRRIRQRRKALNQDFPLSAASQSSNAPMNTYTAIDTPADTRPPTQVVQPRDVEKFGGWEIAFNELHTVRELGKGAFGVVYLCRWRNTDCATKQLDFGQDEQCVQRFLKEAENVKSLKPHPNVCTVLGVCTNPNSPICIVMEYLPDGNLEDLIYEKKIPMDARRLVEFAKDVASGMSHLHAENILHCDLACRNLLVASKGSNKFQIKIADFGLSRVLSAETYTVSKQATFPTRWTAPETFKTGKITRANDVWSFGIVLWEMMAGNRPYMEYNNTEVIQKVSLEGYRLPRPDMKIPDSLWKLIEACWVEDPNKRPSFNEIYQQLSHMEM